MENLIQYLITVILGVHLTVVTYAQVDMTSSILVRPSNRENSTPNLDSSRYTVRPSANAKPTKVEEPKVVQPNVAHAPAASEAKTETSMSEVKNGENKKIELVIDDESKAEEYTEQVHPYDSRLNLVNVSVAPSVIYIDSHSDYWFRDYVSSGPGVSLNADIWIDSAFGLKLDYFTTLSANLASDPTTSRTVNIDHRYTDFGFQYRKYSSLSRKASSLNLSVQYSEYKMIIPKAEDQRTGLTTSGVAVGIGARLPTSVTTAWTLGTEFMPKLKVKEDSASAVIKAGTKNSTYAIKFYIGQEYLIDRRNQIFWRVSHRFDKAIYEGDADPVDPITASAPEGVEVRTGSSLFEFGYTWGD